MKILYDHQIFSSQMFGGISRYFYELMDKFHQISDVEIDLALHYSNNSYLQRADWAQSRPFSPRKKFFGRTTLINTVNGIVSRYCIRRGDFDVFHPTYYDPYYLSLIGTKPTVVTVYDMIHELHPELFASNNRTIAWKKAVLARATRIIAISENTKRDLLKFYQVEEQRVTVVHLASSLQNGREVPALSGFPEKYLLFVGQRGGYKNFSFFVRALAPVMLANSDLAVICAGGGNFTPEEHDMLTGLKIADRVRQCQVTDDDLGALYGGALAFVFPSLYEGFGIPVLEAFSSGCPVLLSNKSSLPEVAGNAALFFDPEDEKSLRDAVVKVVSDAELRNSLTTLGYERVKEFSWENVAHETKAVYESLF
jgi:glycosyltransferase involved in cell wall biosynthesis